MKLDIQEEVQKIHAKYGTSEMANYKIQLHFESLFDILLQDSKWIDVNDKLPQTNDLVLTYSEDIMGHKYRLLVPNLNSKSTFPSSVTYWKKLTSP